MADDTPSPKERAALVVEIDAAELAVRMCEANYGIRRPEGATGAQALEAMDADCRAGWFRSAKL